MEKDLRLGFIGAGNIVKALVQGFICSKFIQPDQISVAAPSNNNLGIFKDLGCHVTNENRQIFEHVCKTFENEKKKRKFHYVLFICVKPTVADQEGFWIFLNGEDFRHIRSRNEQLTIISSMAGVSTDHLLERIVEAQLKYEIQFTLARIMPNTACKTTLGVVGLSIAKRSSSLLQYDVTRPENIISDLRKLLDQLGSCFLIPENQMDAVCGLSGSGIAFVYSFIQAMADGGVLVGLPRSLSTQITLQTIIGATRMVEENKANPISLRDLVCSPAGTTIHGIHALEKGSFNCTVMDAIKAATERSKAFSETNKM